MRLANHRALLCAVLATPVLVGVGEAAAGTPVSTPPPPEPADCAVAARPQDELRLLTLRGLEAVGVGATAAPSIGTLSSPPRKGEPADAATTAAATETIRQFLACSNAHNLGALTALLTDDSAAVLLAASAKGFAGGEALASGTPVQEIDIATLEVNPGTVEAFIATNATPTPRSRDDWSTLDDVRAVRRLEGGVVVVAGLVAFDPGEPVEYDITLREIQGRYVIDLLPAIAAGALGTPVGTPSP